MPPYLDGKDSLAQHRWRRPASSASDQRHNLVTTKSTFPLKLYIRSLAFPAGAPWFCSSRSWIFSFPFGYFVAGRSITLGRLGPVGVDKGSCIHDLVGKFCRFSKIMLLFLVLPPLISLYLPQLFGLVVLYTDAFPQG